MRVPTALRNSRRNQGLRLWPAPGNASFAIVALLLGTTPFFCNSPKDCASVVSR